MLFNFIYYGKKRFRLSNLLEVEMNKNPISYNIQYKIYPYVKESLIIDTIWQDKFTYRVNILLLPIYKQFTFLVL